MSIVAMRSTHNSDVNLALASAAENGGCTVWTINRYTNICINDTVIVFTSKKDFGKDRDAWENQFVMVGRVTGYARLDEPETHWPSCEDNDIDYIHQYKLDDVIPVRLRDLEQFAQIDALRQFKGSIKLR